MAEFYFNVCDEGDHPEGARAWEDMRRLGFICAGCGPRFTSPLNRLKAGDTVFAYQARSGYVGVGTVTSMPPAKMAKEVIVDGRPLLDLAGAAPHFGHDRSDPNMAEHVVRVEWLHTVPITEAVAYPGIFSNPNVVCRLRHQDTLDFLRDEFGLLAPGEE